MSKKTWLISQELNCHGLSSRGFMGMGQYKNMILTCSLEAATTNPE